MLQDSDSWLDLLQVGLGHARSGDFDRALEHFKQARELAPTRPETACALGREHMRRGQVDEALELFEEAWNQDQSLVTAGTSLARCLGLDQGEFARAHAVLDDVDARFPDEATSRLIRAEVLLAERRHEEAALVAPPLLERDSTNVAHSAQLLMARVENERGLCAVQQRGYERAIFAFKRASDLDPAWATPHANLGSAFETLGKLQRAEAAYRRSVEVDTGYARGWHKLYRLLRERRDAEAATCIEEAFRADPARVDIAADFAMALESGGDTESARAVLACHAHGLGDLSDAWASLVPPLMRGGSKALAAECIDQACVREGDPELAARLRAALETASDA